MATGGYYVRGAHRSGRKWWVALLLCCFLGVLGIWTLVDFLFILFGAFTDKEGRKLS